MPDALPAKNDRRIPKQARSLETYEQLLRAAQEILEAKGFKALNSNSVAATAGLSPPSFYRYFADKYALLQVLTERLMDAQNAVVHNEAEALPKSWEDFKNRIRFAIQRTLVATREFKGGYEILICLRAMPTMRPIRLDSHEAMAAFITAGLIGSPEQRETCLVRSRIAVEIGYTIIEMLFETNFKNEDQVLDHMTDAIIALYADLDLF